LSAAAGRIIVSSRAALQAGEPDSFTLRLSGVTPGDHNTHPYRRLRANALHAYSLTQDKTRWSARPFFCIMADRKAAAKALARAMLGGRLEPAGMNERCAMSLGRRWPWIGRLVARTLGNFKSGSRPRLGTLTSFILESAEFAQVSRKRVPPLQSGVEFPPAMLPADGPAETWSVPPFLTQAELARELNLTVNELGWFVDRRRLERHLPDGPLRHYHYRWQTKRHGGARLIESPKQRLKAMQRYILERILDQIPPHGAAHGFCRGRSIKTFSQSHLGQEAVLKVDLKDFFPSVRPARVAAIFLTAGYPDSVASTLAGLCLNSTPATVMDAAPSLTENRKSSEFKKLYGRPHLPQGAPTSPALANLAAYRLDCRLAGLARAAEAAYTRYADDLVFSGGKGFARMAGRFYARVCVLALEEGFEVNTRKTRLMRKSVCQRAAGVVVNERPNVPRSDYDRLKAILHNCARRGPESQNRDGADDFAASLLGRISHVQMLNPVRGAKLQALFARIKW